jgi:hypothetical protein
LDGYQRYSAPIIIAVGHTFSDTFSNSFSTTVLLKKSLKNHSKTHSKTTQKRTHFVTLCSGHRLSEGFSFSEDICRTRTGQDENWHHQTGTAVAATPQHQPVATSMAAKTRMAHVAPSPLQGPTCMLHVPAHDLFVAMLGQSSLAAERNDSRRLGCHSMPLMLSLGAMLLLCPSVG